MTCSSARSPAGLICRRGGKGEIPEPARVVSKLVERREHPGVADVAVNDDLKGVGDPERELRVLLQDEERFPRLGALRECVDSVDSRLDLEVEERHGDHRDADGEDADDREAGHEARRDFPESIPRGSRGGALEPARADEGDRQPVDARPQQRKHGRQQRQRGRQRHQHHEDRADAEGLEEREWHDQQPAEGDHHGDAAEQHRAARRVARFRDRFRRGQAAAHLLPEAGNDEERVVDAHRQADHGDHQRDEEAEFEDLADERHQAQCDGDGHHGQTDRHQRGHDGAEEHEQDDQRDGDAEPFSLLQVFPREFERFEGDAGRSDHQHLEAVRAVGLLDLVKHMPDVLLGVCETARQHQRYQRGRAIGGHEARAVRKGSEGHIDDVASECEKPGEHRVDLLSKRRVFHGQRLGLNDDYFGDGLRFREPFRQQGGGSLRLEAAGEPELGGRRALEQIHVERGGDDHQRHPGADGHPRPPGTHASQQFSQGQIPRTPGRRTRPNRVSSRVAQPARPRRGRPLSLLGAGILAPIRIDRMSARA